MIWKVLLILLFLSGCLGGGEKRDPPLVFAVGGAPSEIDYWEKIINEFEGRREIGVRVLRQPTDTDLRRQSLVTPLQAGKSEPDVFLMDGIWVAFFAASGWLWPLDSFIQRDRFDLANFFEPVVREVNLYRGRMMSLPVYIDSGILYFRKDLLEKYQCSVPRTWAELLQCAALVQEQEKRKNPQFYGFVWQGAQYEGLVCSFLEFVSSHGGGILKPDGRVRVDQKENVQALQFMIDLIHRHRVSPPNTFTEMKEEEVRTFFEGGQALFERNWPYAWKLHERENSAVKGKVGMEVLPHIPGGRSAATLGGWHVGISKFSTQKGKAWELVKYVLSPPVQKRLALDLGWNPGRKDLYDDPEVQREMPQMRILRKALEVSVSRPPLPYYTLISEMLQVYVNAALSGKMGASEALKQAQGQIDRIIKVYHE